MNNSAPPLTWLRAFEAAARHLSFTRAADELGLTQSAISQHVRALEAKLAQPLFHRAHRQLHLTDAGRLLLPDVTAGLALLSQATRRFGQAADTDLLRVTTSASVAHWLLAPNIAAFRATHPNTVVELRTTVWPDDFIATSSDVEIRFGRGEMVGAAARLIEPSYLHAVATPDVARQFRDGQDQTFIQPVGLSTEWPDVLDGAQPGLRVDTHGMAVELAVEGGGVALTHSLITRPAILAGRLVELPLPRCPAQEGYYLAAAETEAAQAFAAWVTGVIRAQWQTARPVR